MGGPFFLEPEQHTVFSLHRNESLRSFKSRCATFISLKLEIKNCKGGFQRRTLSGMTKLIVRGIPVLNMLRCETVVPVSLSKTINPASGIPLLICKYSDVDARSLAFFNMRACICMQLLSSSGRARFVLTPPAVRCSSKLAVVLRIDSSTPRFLA